MLDTAAAVVLLVIQPLGSAINSRLSTALLGAPGVFGQHGLDLPFHFVTQALKKQNLVPMYISM